MKVLDPGHRYELSILDGDARFPETLTFVKREGEGYPGNVGSHPGTTSQDVMRALIDRARYVNTQIGDRANEAVIECLQEAIWQLEERAARRHGRSFDYEAFNIELQPTCEKCHHIGCGGGCR